MKKIMLPILILCSSALTATPPVWAEPKPEAGQLKNMVIEGDTRLKMKGDKPSFLPDLNPRPALENYLAQELARANPTEKISISYPTYLPSKVVSDVVLSPWHGQLVSDPVLYLSIKRPEKLSVKEWRLVITDDRGKVFRNIRGKGELPEHVTWDGIGDEGKPLKVGRSYAYSLSILDQAEIPTYLFGKTVRISGFFQEKEAVTISMETEILFKQGPDISEQGLAFLREAQDLLRKKRALSIAVYGADLDLAQRQAELVRKFMAEAMHISEATIDVKATVQDEKNIYARTEISGRTL